MKIGDLLFSASARFKRILLRFKRVKFKTVVMFIMAAGMVLLLAIAVINAYILTFARPYIYSDLNDLPEKYTVIVPGARVYKNSISLVARDRIAAAAECLSSGKAERVLISGDHGRKGYDEVRMHMQKAYAVEDSKIFMDHAGFSTYETMYRADSIFCVKDAIVVTQKFHAARSVYIARKMGMDVVAYEAPEIAKFSKSLHMSWNIRESLARVKTFFLVLFRAKPTYLGEKIPIGGNSKESWD